MEKKFPTLYGLSSKGVVKSWKIWVAEFPLESAIMVEHGQIEGKKQLAVETIREGKNIGKSNETSPFEQAVLEAESKWNKKHDSNYTESLPEGETNIELKLLPMLANKYKERKHTIDWMNTFEQPKLNGCRCLVERRNDKITFWSRKSKQYRNFNLYMEQEFLSFMKNGDILDGEMYNHRDITFQELMSLITDETTPNLESLKKYVKFHCYDRPSGDLDFSNRYLKYRHDIPNGLNYLRLVETFKVTSEKDVALHHGHFIADGYEGSIIRSGNEPYKFQYRANQLLKNKDFYDAEYKIIGCKEGTGKDEGKAIFRCVTEEGVGGITGIGDFDVRCKGTDKYRSKQWENRLKYIGEMLTVRYPSFTDDKIPQHGVGVIVRDYE